MATNEVKKDTGKRKGKVSTVWILSIIRLMQDRTQLYIYKFYASLVKLPRIPCVPLFTSQVM